MNKLTNKGAMRVAEIKGEMYIITKAIDLHLQAAKVLQKRATKLSQETKKLAKKLGIEVNED